MHLFCDFRLGIEPQVIKDIKGSFFKLIDITNVCYGDEQKLEETTLDFTMRVKVS